MGALSGKKVIVIGGSAGIGMATAAHALRAGAEVALSARGAERLQRAAEALAKEGGCIAHETLDMRDRPAVAGYLARQAPFDHLILPGATVYRTTFSAMEEDKAKGSVHAKFWGPFWAAYDARDHTSGGTAVSCSIPASLTAGLCRAMSSVL
ncbi:MAG: SDR family NAD(P)-dependent oxidoreductase [Alphaproteobacteria bacterium]